ncbi:MAG TPA: ABC transporter permease [Thermoanaerobaculia bacterium]|nr:ABC transporter permease [Thermoanaerobaculia bacterium]
MQSLRQDIRFAFHTLALKPGFTLAALLCAALGIGLCTTLFSATYAMLLRPFPFAHPESLVGIFSANDRIGVDHGGVSFPDYTDLERLARSFSAVAGYAETSLTLSAGDQTELVQGAAVSHRLFPLLGVEPFLGRLFTAAEDRPGAPGSVVLSHALWTRSFEADPRVIGRWIAIDGRPHQIVGIMPSSFQFPVQQQAWVPMSPSLAGHSRGEREIDVLARLRPGVSLSQARAETAALAARLAVEYPGLHAGWQWRTLALRDLFVSPGMRVMSLTMMGAATFVLLIACANVANLLLAWAAGRQREMSVRAALGASPGRIVRQLLTESMLLALGGGALGSLLALAGVRQLALLFPASAPVPYWMVFSLDPPVLAFTAAAAAATGLLFGLVPALQAARTDLLSALNEGGRAMSGGAGTHRLRSALVIAEVSLSVVLLIGGALFVRSFFAVDRVSTGFDEGRLLTLRVYLAGDKFAGDGARTRWLQALLPRLESLPGVEAASASRLVPLAGGASVSPIGIAGKTFPKGEEPRIAWAAVTPGFFRTLDVPIASGRGWSAAEGWEGRPVAVVNQTFVARFFPPGGAVGRRFLLAEPQPPRWLTVVGVVRDFKTGSLERPPSPAAYLPYPFFPARETGILVRTRLEPGQLTATVRRTIAAFDPGVPLFEVATMREVRGAATWQYRLVSKLFSTLGVLALGLAAIGIYGVLSYTVSRRSREIGTRVALGAPRGAVIGLIVRQGMMLAGIGVAVGLVGAFLLSRVLASFLYGISAADPLSFGGLSLFLLAVAALASYLPARRATRLDPTAALQGGS